MAKKLLLGFILLANYFKGQTIIPDLSYVSGNWTLAGSPYIIQGRAIVPPTSTLTIAPGVQVRFKSTTDSINTAIWSPDTNVVGSLRVRGKLIANGNAQDTISFVADGQGYWGSLFLTTGAYISSTVSYCKFKNMYSIYGQNASLNTYETYQGFSYNPNTNFTILHCSFEDNQYAFSAGDVNSTNLLTIGYCKFKNNNNSWGYSTTYPSSMNIWEPCKINNSIFDNSPFAINGITIANCILMNSDTAPFYQVIVPMVPNTNALINSLICNNKIALLWNQTSVYNAIFLNNARYDTIGGTFDKCLFDGAGFPGWWTTSTTNYFNANPNLVDPTHGDFHLLSTSACIDSGTTMGIASLIPNTDLDGNARYVGPIDIGPYEYQGPADIVSHNNQDQVIVFPNPASNYIYIEGSLINGVQIKDLIGNTISCQTKNDAIDVSDLPNGIYLLLIKMNGYIVSRKISVEH